MSNRYISKSRSESLRIFEKLDTTSSSDLIIMCRKLGIKLVENRIFMKDELRLPLREGNYILNLDDAGGSGTHWTCFIKRNENIYYCDSFGQLPPQDQIDLFKKDGLKLYYSTQKNQDIYAESCGFWVIYFLYYMDRNKKKSLAQKFIDFNKQFSKDDQKANEKKLRDLINKII